MPQVADAEGLAALSMRQVADRLGVGTMSLYSHVPGKAEPLDAMLDTVYGELPVPGEVTSGWRAQLELLARANLFEFGLQRVLDGVEVLVRSRVGSAGARARD